MQKIIPIPHEDFAGQELKVGDRVAYIAQTPPKLFAGIVIGFTDNTVNINICNDKWKPIKKHYPGSCNTHIQPHKIVKIDALHSI